ncbi:hypothetical protein Tdes44962_MAKER06530, partial [Teratosphaeria destructans]
MAESSRPVPEASLCVCACRKRMPAVSCAVTGSSWLTRGSMGQPTRRSRGCRSGRRWGICGRS